MAAVAVGAMAAWSQAAGPALNILFYGNSFTLQGAAVPGVTGVPELVQRIATSAGQPTPSVVNAAVSGQTLSYHITSNTAVISSSPQSGSWDYVVLQEYSTKPTDITGVGNPTGFKADSQTLYGKVKANSPGVKPVLFETWSRHPSDTSELGLWYPAQSTYTAKANQMQAELKQYYGQAQSLLGGPACGLAPVGDAFQASGWDASLYNGDFYHESSKGALLAALIIYETIYHDTTSDIPFATMNANLSLSSYNVGSTSAWASLTAQADAAVPEPVSAGLLMVGGLILAARRRA